MLSRFNSLGSSVALSDAMAALLLLANANVHGSQPIEIIAATAPKSTGLSPRSTTEHFVKAVQYELIASVLRQCERAATPTRQTGIKDGYTAHTHEDLPSYQRRHNDCYMRRRRMTFEEDGVAKLTKTSTKCGKYSH